MRAVMQMSGDEETFLGIVYPKICEEIKEKYGICLHDVPIDLGDSSQEDIIPQIIRVIVALAHERGRKAGHYTERNRLREISPRLRLFCGEIYRLSYEPDWSYIMDAQSEAMIRSIVRDLLEKK